MLTVYLVLLTFSALGVLFAGIEVYLYLKRNQLRKVKSTPLGEKIYALFKLVLYTAFLLPGLFLFIIILFNPETYERVIENRVENDDNIQKIA